MTGSDYRSKALDEYGAICSDCGSEESVEVHHKDRDRSNNDIENLEVLCEDCHFDRHREEFKKRASGPRKEYNSSDKQRSREGRPESNGNGSFLRDSDIAIIDVLRDGRANAPFIADETGYSTQYIRNRLGRLKEADAVQPLGHGLYAVAEAAPLNN